MSPMQKKKCPPPTTVCDVMESVFLSVNEHLTSVGEDLVEALCVSSQPEQRRHRVRLFVLQRLRVAAQWMCSLFHRQLESLLLLEEEEADASKLHTKLHPADYLHVTVCEEEELSPEQCQERTSRLVQDDPQPPPHIKVEQQQTRSRLVQEEPQPPHVKEEQQERRSRLVQDKPQPPPHIKEEQEEVADVSTVAIVRMRCNTDSDFLLPPVCKRERRSPRLIPEKPESPWSQERTFGLVQEEPRPPRRQERTFGLVQEEPQPQERTFGLVQEEPRPPRRQERRSSPVLEEEEEEPQALQHLFPEEPECPQHEERTFGLVKQEPWSPLGSPPGEDDPLRSLEDPQAMAGTSVVTEARRPDPSEEEEETRSARRSRASPATRTGTFGCPECGKTFARPGHLKVHRTLHNVATGGHAPTGHAHSPYTCPECGKACSQSGALKIHMRSHTGEKPFVCAVCGKRCVDASGLRSHMKTHTGEKPFVCGVCGKGCSRKNDLKIHLRTHTGEKPYTCAICNKAFVHVGHLRRHMKTHVSF